MGMALTRTQNHLPAVVAVGFLFALAGCESSPSGEPTVRTFSSPQVRQGEMVWHDFKFTNRHDVPIYIADRENDIRKDCGCTNVVLDSEWLGPGDSTTVTLQVDTAGREGEMATSALLAWSVGEGQKENAVFRLEVSVVAPLNLEPAALVFSENDVISDRGLEVRLGAAVDVDWTTLSFSSQSSYFHVSEPRVSGSTASVHITCDPPGLTRHINATLFANLRCARAGSSAPVDSGWLRRPLEVSFRPDLEKSIHVHPERPTVWLKDDGSASATFIVQSILITRTSPAVASIECEGYNVAFDSLCTSGQEMIELKLAPLERAESPNELVLVFRGGAKTIVPVKCLNRVKRQNT